MCSETEIFKAFSDEARIRIMNLFIKSMKAICVCELMDSLKLPQYSVSKALLILKNIGLLKTMRQGLWVYYKLNEDNYENNKIFEFLSRFLINNIFRDDEKRLEERFILRENDKCIIRYY